MNRPRRALVVAGLVAAVLLFAGTEAQAFRMIQRIGVGRFSSGVRVTCTDPDGFVHWTHSHVLWRHNPAHQGADKAAALQNAMATWTGVSAAYHSPRYAGTTTAEFVTDGINTVLWADGNGCTGSCLALTALVLASGQVIVECDVTFNDAVHWATNGSNFDAEAVILHELGHTLGIHHTELNPTENRPTMFANYIGLEGRSLEPDDRSALQCSQSRYPPIPPSFAGERPQQLPEEGSERLVSRPAASGARLRFSLDRDSEVRLCVYDVAGRRMATLADGRRAGGDHELAWDGSVAGGHARPGVYFARLVVGERVTRATVVLAR